MISHSYRIHFIQTFSALDLMEIGIDHQGMKYLSEALKINRVRNLTFISH